MKTRDFAYWLQGFVEITGDMDRPSEKQWTIIKDHLQLVFTKETPDRTENEEVSQDGEIDLDAETQGVKDQFVGLIEKANEVTEEVDVVIADVNRVLTQFRPSSYQERKDDKIC